MELSESSPVSEASAEELLMRNNLRGFTVKAMVLEKPNFGTWGVGMFLAGRHTGAVVEDTAIVSPFRGTDLGSAIILLLIKHAWMDKITLLRH